MTTWILKICQIYKMKQGIRERTNRPHPTKKAETDNRGDRRSHFSYLAYLHWYVSSYLFLVSSKKVQMYVILSETVFFFLKFLYRISVTLYILRDYFVSSIGTAPNFSNECFVLLQIDYSLAYISYFYFLSMAVGEHLQTFLKTKQSDENNIFYTSRLNFFFPTMF